MKFVRLLFVYVLNRLSIGGCVLYILSIHSILLFIQQLTLGLLKKCLKFLVVCVLIRLWRNHFFLFFFLSLFIYLFLYLFLFFFLKIFLLLFSVQIAWQCFLCCKMKLSWGHLGMGEFHIVFCSWTSHLLVYNGAIALEIAHSFTGHTINPHSRNNEKIWKFKLNL